MKFRAFRDQMTANFDSITMLRHAQLFEVDADKDKLWELYLSSFPAEANPIYRVRTEHDCSCCRNFIKNAGRVVYFDEELKMCSIFGFTVEDAVYQNVLDALNRYVLSCPVVGEYLSPDKAIGTAITREYAEDKSIITFEHLSVNLPQGAVFMKRRSGDTIDTERGRFRDLRNVFKRSLDEITMEAVDTVLELITSNTLYKGAEWRPVITKFKTQKKEYEELPFEKRDAYCWVNAAAAGDVLGKIRNTSIGTLLMDISEGMDLDEAVRRYEAIVAPANYKRPKAIYTKQMLEEAQKTVVELGYMDSLARRYATLDDITVNNILFSNRDAAKRIGGSVFDEMLQGVKTDPKRFSRAEEIGIEKFLSDVLPTTSSVEAFVENRHESNFVSLIAPVNRDAKSMFKWNNGFSWAYTGNMTDSDIRENVKRAGGRVDGVLRFSIQWNDLETDLNDLDAHCVLPTRNEISYMDKRAYDANGRCIGNLDVDIIHPIAGVPAVENITFPQLNWMKPGEYKFYVRCFSNRGGRGGFRAEIEFEGQVFRYDYRESLRMKGEVPVATVTLDANGKFNIKEHLTSELTPRDIWGVKTQTFTPVTVVMNSPNYWDEQQGIGHKHYFFMLKDCVNPESPNGFYNEFLKQELVEHKRVFEALGSKMAVAPMPDQLSGVGFSSTKRNSLTVKVKTNSNTERVFNIKF